MTKIKLLPFFLFGLCGTSVQAQTTDLLDLHRQNLESLYHARGVSSEWYDTGEVSEDEIIDLLDFYSAGAQKLQVGVLLYTHYADTLVISLYRSSYFSPNRLELKRYISQDSLAKVVADVNNSLANPYFANAVRQRGVEIYDQNAYNLQNAVSTAVPILLPFIDSLLVLDHLVIVPTLTIGTLPFSALPLDDSILLVDLMSISIAPSILEVMISNHSNATQQHRDFYSTSIGPDKVAYNFKNALLVANPTYPKNKNFDFPQLPGTITEIEQVIPFINSGGFHLLTGENANPQNVLKNIHSRDLLYFATHGISSSENALDSSFLVLARDNSKKFLLSSREIMNLRQTQTLNAELVILSACQTGLGVQHQGGIIGLSRAFQIAGANHVVMSLWSINDEQTAILMGFFFENLKNAEYLMPHEALRQAILRYRNEVNDDPSVWAAFTIFGIPY